LKPVMVAAEKFGTKAARSPMLRGLDCRISDWSTAEMAIAVD
jgi:hypothetical protein